MKSSWTISAVLAGAIAIFPGTVHAQLVPKLSPSSLDIRGSSATIDESSGTVIMNNATLRTRKGITMRGSRARISRDGGQVTFEGAVRVVDGELTSLGHDVRYDVNSDTFSSSKLEVLTDTPAEKSPRKD